MNEVTSGSGDEHLPSRSSWRRLTSRPRALAGATAAGLVVLGGVALAASNDDENDASAVGSTTASSASTVFTTSGPASATSATESTRTSTSTTDTSTAATSSIPSALTTAPGQTFPTAPPDTSPVTTLPAPPRTTPPAPSTTGPDTRSPRQAYAQEYERYCRQAFSISPNGVLADPDFIDDTYTVDDCLYWLDPDWGDFFDTAAEGAQGGIDDAISTMEDMTSFSGTLCWLDPETEQWGGCWFSPNG